MNRFLPSLLTLLVLAFTEAVSAGGGVISFSTVMLDSTGKFFFTYPTALLNKAALQELQKNFIRQKFGEKFLKQEPVAALKLYKNQNRELEYLFDKVSLPLPGIVQFETSYYAYSNDVAHGISSFNVGFYSLSDGKKIELSSFFDEGWEKEVTELIIKEFLYSQNLQSLSDYGYTQKESDFIPVNAKISEYGGLDFIYPVYKIAPYATGEQVVFLSWNALKPYLNKKSIIYQRLTW
jgi:hypothetical protein